MKKIIHVVLLGVALVSALTISATSVWADGGGPWPNGHLVK
jgi:hypothetical protein